MEIENAYEAPETEVLIEEQVNENDEKASKVAKAQKIIIYSILGYFLSFGLMMIISELALIAMIIVFIIGAIGFVRLFMALGISVIVTIICCLAMFIPLISLITLLVANSKATAFLKKNGYKVGLLGAKKIEL